ncbi:MAG TPA: hypothetical protein VK501_11410 [Baekduia sp.]|uniref:hypothetical protein n=1 Tax=Baekduia sp. TaxID=2600305 RepID=UPI002BC68887|nr:hypothetical protein [Baekduia sp.]HMJ34515.1 hypothetical protein [Baekduia sp.]
MDTLERLRELHPDGAARLAHLNTVASGVTDPQLLALCVTCADTMLQGASYDIPSELDAREVAALEFTEQFVTSVGDVSDEQVQALLEHLSPEELYGFIGALYVREMTRRVELVAGRVLR